MTTRRQFTLIELVVVLVVISIVAAISAPQLMRFYASTKLDQAARRAIVFWGAAADRATARRVPQCITLEPDWRSARLYAPAKYQPGDDPTAEGADLERVEGPIGSWELPEGVTLQLLTTDGQNKTPGTTVRIAVYPLFQPAETRLELANDSGDCATVVLPAGGGRGHVEGDSP